MSDAAITLARAGGMVAFAAGQRLSSNPHALAGAPWRAWRAGWIGAASESVTRETGRGRGRNRADWTETETLLLLRLIKEPAVALKEVAQIIGRSRAAVTVKACRLRKEAA